MPQKLQMTLIRCALMLAMGCLAVGCRAQIPVNPTVYTCPVTTGTAYTPLNQTTPATGTSYSDTTATAGEWCYIAQSVLGGQSSAPSNTAGPVNFLSTDQSVAVSWTAPTSGPTPSGYAVSRAPATASTILAPTLSTSPTVSGNVKPALPEMPAAQLTYLDSTVAEGQSYDYIVESVDASGIDSAPSNIATAIVPGDAPGPITITIQVSAT